MSEKISLIKPIVERLNSACLDIETDEPLDDDARPDIYVSDVRRTIVEIERLRAALREIAELQWDAPAAVARAALGKEEP